MRTISLLVLGSLLAAPALAQQARPDTATVPPPTRISGTILGGDGNPMPLANVALFGTDGRITGVEAERNGRFTLETDSTGMLTLVFAGVDHERKTVSVLVRDRGEDTRLDVRLRTYSYNTDLSKVEVIGDFNHLSLSQGARRMELQSDSTYVLEIQVDSGADSLAYQLLNTVGSGHSVNGTQSDWFVYDGHGDYRSVIRAKDGIAVIHFDPSKLSRVEDTASVTFRDPRSAAARYARFLKAIEDARAPYNAGRRRLTEEKASRDSIGAWMEAYDWSPLDALKDSALAATEDADLRTTLLAGYVASAPHIDSLAARTLLAEVPPESWKWTIGYDLLTRAIGYSGQPDAYADFVLALLRKNPHESLRAEALQVLLFRAVRNKTQDEQDLLYAWLVSEYPESFQARYAKSQFDPERAIQIGKAVPAFSLPGVDDSTVTYSNESMKGTVYLLDFWAVWCGPCIGELPSLEAAYQKYHDDGFTILSVSFDQRPEDVIEYRAKGEHPMPWLHAFVPGGFENPVAKTFGVLGIPTVLLVGSDGEILATSGLRGEALDGTLARLLEPEKPEGKPKQ